MSKIQELSKPLSVKDIEFRIGATKQGSGFSLLAYKTARTDVKRLNEVFGLNWSNEYFYDSKGLLCSKISVKDGEEWISRIDVGTESNTEKEKGSYSDAFKRAGFKFGIGIELYDFPFIWLQWNDWRDYNGKKTPNFQASNLKVEAYECKDGEVTLLKLSYRDNIVFKHEINRQDNKKLNPPSKASADEKKQAWSDFQTICNTMGVDGTDFMQSNIDMSDKNGLYAEVRKWLSNEQLLRDQLLVFKNG